MKAALDIIFKDSALSSSVSCLINMHFQIVILFKHLKDLKGHKSDLRHGKTWHAGKMRRDCLTVKWLNWIKND